MDYFNFGSNNNKKDYSYYDTPDGEDGPQKLIYTTKKAFQIGSFAALTDIMLVSKPKGIGPAIGRYCYVITPFVGTTVAFTITTYLATNLRKKDDEFNYALGGVAAGIVHGTWRKSFKTGFNICLCYAIFAASCKYLLKLNVPLLPTSKWNHPNPNLWSYSRDYSFSEDPPRTWKTKHD